MQYKLTSIIFEPGYILDMILLVCSSFKAMKRPLSELIDVQWGE